MGALISTREERELEYESLLDDVIFELEDKQFDELPTDKQLALVFAKWSSLPADEAYELLAEVACQNGNYVELMQQGRLEEAQNIFKEYLIEVEINGFCGIGVQTDIEHLLAAIR